MKIVKGNKKDLRPAVKEIDEIMKKRYKNKNTGSCMSATLPKPAIFAASSVAAFCI